MTINIIQPNVTIDDEISTIIYGGNNFGIPLHFLDEYGMPTTPLTLTYTIFNDAGMVSTYTPIPEEVDGLKTVLESITSYVIEISSEDNTIVDDLEERKTIVEWTYARDDFTTGKSIQEFHYTIEQP
jgi:hypothetical protein